MAFDPQPVLGGSLVQLRPLRAEDWHDLYAVAADPLIWEQHPASNRHEREVFEEFFRVALAGGGALVACDATSGRMIGSSRYHGWDEARSEVEIGWTFLARSHWGGAWNGEMKQLMLRHAFQSFRSVVFLVGAGNIRSQRAVLKIGARRDGSRTDASGRESFLYRISAGPELGPSPEPQPCTHGAEEWMEFNLSHGTAVLERTPGALRAMLAGLPAAWLDATEGPDTWSPYVVVGHLIHGERTDWIPRARIILAQGENRRFTPYDRFAQFRESEGKSLAELLDEFARLRSANLNVLAGWRLTEAQLDLAGEHPEFGAVTLRQLLATWVAHDLGHLAQVARVMAKQYREAVGPWRAYLSIMER